MTTRTRDLDGFIDHYLAERDALRRAAGTFAEAYPRVAGRLRLQDEDHPDPHVERLRQSSTASYCRR